MKRFSVEAFPSVFLVEGAETRAYTGLRTLQEVKSTLIRASNGMQDFCALAMFCIVVLTKLLCSTAGELCFDRIS